MPTYQYRCTECGHDLEATQKFSDPALTECPECSGPLRKVFNAVGVVFKGSGFYRTDSRSSGKGAGSSERGTSEPKQAKEPAGAPASNGSTAAKSASTSERAGSSSEKGSKSAPAPASGASSTGSTSR